MNLESKNSKFHVCTRCVSVYEKFIIFSSLSQNVIYASSQYRWIFSFTLRREAKKKRGKFILEAGEREREIERGKDQWIWEEIGNLGCWFVKEQNVTWWWRTFLVFLAYQLIFTVNRKGNSVVTYNFHQLTPLKIFDKLIFSMIVSWNTHSHDGSWSDSINQHLPPFRQNSCPPAGHSFIPSFNGFTGRNLK